jgi:hypothetical protein
MPGELTRFQPAGFSRSCRLKSGTVEPSPITLAGKPRAKRLALPINLALLLREMV